MSGAPGHHFTRIEPGDIGFDGGIGLSGFLIRVGTRSAYGHCWVYQKDLGNGVWQTVEAGPRGLRVQKRTVGANKVVRVWRHEGERHALLRCSSLMVGRKYGWGEIARIVCHLFGVKLTKRADNPLRVICSNHVAQSILAARPDFEHYMDYQPYEIWPGELAVSLDEFMWETR
jgi:hypothetical protein